MPYGSVDTDAIKASIAADQSYVQSTTLTRDMLERAIEKVRRTEYEACGVTRPHEFTPHDVRRAAGLPEDAGPWYAACWNCGSVVDLARRTP